MIKSIAIGLFVTALSMLASPQVEGQMPQPIRNPGFGSTIPTARGQSAVYPAQAFQTIGKQLGQRRSPRSTSDGQPSSRVFPWLERMIQPRDKKTDQPQLSVAGTQPPLNDHRGRAVNRSKDSDTATEDMQIPTMRMRDDLVPETRSGLGSEPQYGQSRDAARYEPNSPYHRDALSPRTSRSSLLPNAMRTEELNPKLLPQLGQNANDQSEAKPSNEQVSASARTPKKTTAEAPKVSRVPLPGTKEKDSNGQESDNEPAERNPLVAAEESSAEAKVASNTAPMKLVASPSSQNAAQDNENAKAKAQFVTSQLRKAAVTKKQVDQELANSEDASQPEPARTEKLPEAEPSEPQADVAFVARPDLPLPERVEPERVEPERVEPERVEPEREEEPETRSSTKSSSLPTTRKATEAQPNALPKLPALQSASESAIAAPEMPELQPKEVDNTLKSSSSAYEASATKPSAARAENEAGASNLRQVETATVEVAGSQQDGAQATTTETSAGMPTEAVETTQQRSDSPALPPLPSHERSHASPAAQLTPITPQTDRTGVLTPSNSGAPKHDHAQLRAPQQLNVPSLPLANLDRDPLTQAISSPAIQRKTLTFGMLPAEQAGIAARASDERMRMRAPRLEVVLQGPAQVPVSQPAGYQIIATNRDAFDLNGLMLQLEVPKGVAVRKTDNSLTVEETTSGGTVLTWAIEKLAAGAQRKADVLFMTQSTQDFVIDVEWTLIPLADRAAIHVVAPSLQLKVEGPEEVVYGENNQYRMRVRNAGEAKAAGVQLDIEAGELGQTRADVGDLAPGEERVMDLDLRFVHQGELNLRAIAFDVNQAKAPAELQVLVRRQALKVALNAPPLVYHGEAVPYRVLLTNEGDAESKPTIGVLQFPTDTAPVSLPYGAKRVGQKLAWQIDAIGAGETREFVFQLQMLDEGDHTIRFECQDDVGKPIMAQANTQLQFIADLKLLVSDPIAPAPIGSEVTYELSLTNRGSKAASNVRVVAQFSRGIEPTRATGQPHKVVPGQVFFEPIPTVGPGKTILLKVIAQAEVDGMHRFRAEVQSDGEAVRLVQEESTQYLETAQIRTQRQQVASPSTQRSSLR